MFYSHEILTSREHGVATIWLVATLGSRSSLKKISRRAILGVDVSKACKTIADPDTPLALRLQSSLLFGVSRVFSQQCGYILTDLQSLNDKMRVSSFGAQDVQIDNALILTSNEQLNLPVDPGFDPNIDMRLDMPINDDFPTIEQLTSLSPSSLMQHQPTIQQDDQNPGELQLQFPSADTLANERFTFGTSSDLVMSLSPIHANHGGSELDDPVIDQDPFFEINDDDMIVDKVGSVAAAQDIAAQDTDTSLGVDLAVANYENIGTLDHANFQRGISPGLDQDFVTNADSHDNLLYPTQPQTLLDAIVTSNAVNSSRVSMLYPSSAEIANEPSAEAPQKQSAKLMKVPKPDRHTELTNSELKAWQDDYVNNMLAVRIEKASKQSLTLAKSNAAFWVLEQGIGGTSIHFREDREKHPLSVFSGHTLMSALMGTNFQIAGTKRFYDDIAVDVDDGEGQARRLRTASEAGVARCDSQAVLHDDDYAGMLLDPDNEVESQRGRQPASSLKDYPSSMPWNLVSSSHHGTIRGSAQPLISSSVHSMGLNIGPSIVSGRKSRFVSASPLTGRGRASTRLGSLKLLSGMPSSDLDFEEFQDPYEAFTGDPTEDFQLYGPAAGVSTQQAAESQWLAATLENEAHNFLVFLDAQIAQTSYSDEAGTSTTFARLLPPEQNSYIVAAQAILHVLTLTSKGLVSVQQDDAFGDIVLSIVE